MHEQEAGIHRHVLPVDTGTADGIVNVPYFVLQGRRQGPTIFVSAGEHGIEINGIAAIVTFVRTFQPADYTGQIIAVPVITPPNVTYRHHTKGQPRGKGYLYEMPYNTYARWPGRQDGDPADRICHAIATRLLPGVSCVLNFHSWCWHSASAAHSGGNPSVTNEIELGEKLGIPFFIRTSPEAANKPEKRCLHCYASFELGIPAYMVELRNQWWILDEESRRGERAIRNICRYFGVRTDALEVEAKRFHISSEETLVHAPHAGLYVPRLPIETPVRKGQVLGDLYDLDSGRLTKIVSPCDGITWLTNRVGKQADVILEDMHACADKGDLLALIKLG